MNDSGQGLRARPSHAYTAPIAHPFYDRSPLGALRSLSRRGTKFAAQTSPNSGADIYTAFESTPFERAFTTFADIRSEKVRESGVARCVQDAEDAVALQACDFWI